MNRFQNRPENIFLNRSATYDPTNYEFSIYCIECMQRVKEEFSRCCGTPIENIFNRKLYYKVNRMNRIPAVSYHPCTLTIRDQELKTAYPYTMPAVDLPPAVLSFLNRCQYSDYENVTMDINEVQSVFFKDPRVNLGVRYVKDILSSGWQPYYMMDSFGYVFIVGGDNSQYPKLQIDTLQIRLYINRPKLYSSFMKAVTKYDRDGVSHGYYLLPPELWEIIFQYYVLYAYLHWDITC